MNCSRHRGRHYLKNISPLSDFSVHVMICKISQTTQKTSQFFQAVQIRALHKCYFSKILFLRYILTISGILKYQALQFRPLSVESLHQFIGIHWVSQVAFWVSDGHSGQGIKFIGPAKKQIQGDSTAHFIERQYTFISTYPINVRTD